MQLKKDETLFFFNFHNQMALEILKPAKKAPTIVLI